MARAQQHQGLPFEKLVSEFSKEIDTSRHPIFQILFIFQSFQQNQWGELFQRLDSLRFFNTAKFELTLLIDDSQSDIQGCINFSTSIFKKETIDGYVETYLVILKQFENIWINPNFSIEDLSYLSDERRREVCIMWNATNHPFPQAATIPQLFEQQVEETPNQIAVQCENISLTYSELNIEANRIANYIHSLFCIRPESRIALFLKRDEKSLIGILAILKAGGAYVPIDINYPDERIAYILQDANIQLVLTHSEFTEKLSVLRRTAAIHSFEMIPIDRMGDLAQNRTNPQTLALSSNLAYVIYTSGTTGHPKGVMIEHHSYIAAVLGLGKRILPLLRP